MGIRVYEAKKVEEDILLQLRQDGSGVKLCVVTDKGLEQQWLLKVTTNGIRVPVLDGTFCKIFNTEHCRLLVTNC